MGSTKNQVDEALALNNLDTSLCNCHQINNKFVNVVCISNKFSQLTLSLETRMETYCPLNGHMGNAAISLSKWWHCLVLLKVRWILPCDKRLSPNSIDDFINID